MALRNISTDDCSGEWSSNGNIAEHDVMAMLLCIGVKEEPLMQRTTIMLPNELRARAQRRASELGMSLGQFIRESLTARLSRVENQTEDPLFEDSAVFEGDAGKDLARNHDRYLYGDTL